MFSSEYLTSMEKMISTNSLKYNGLNTKAAVFKPKSGITKPNFTLFTTANCETKSVDCETKSVNCETTVDYLIVSNRISNKLKKKSTYESCNDSCDNTIKKWKSFLYENNDKQIGSRF